MGKRSAVWKLFWLVASALSLENTHLWRCLLGKRSAVWKLPWLVVSVLGLKDTPGVLPWAGCRTSPA